MYEFDVNRMQSANRHAYSWILDRLRNYALIRKEEGSIEKFRLLDFGSRYSVLPSLIIRTGSYDVTCSDRDSENLMQQLKIAEIAGVKPPSNIQWDGILGPPYSSSFEVVTASWVIQHNLEAGHIEKIVDNLKSVVNIGGRLMVVASHTDKDSFVQSNREDPQWVLNTTDHFARIISGFGELVDLRYFRYVHASDDGEWLNSGTGANAICYEVSR